MIETELKITLDAPAMARVRRHPALAGLRLAPRRRERLVSIYYDTAGSALAAAGVSLRLRRVGRAWVQTIKRRDDATAANGLFSHRETEVPAPGGRLLLEGADPEGALAAVAAAAAGAPLSPVFETRVERVTELLRAADGSEVELALDAGEIRAGPRRWPIREAELELKAGNVTALYAVAREILAGHAVRFGTLNKAARGYRLAACGTGEPELAPRRAGAVPVDAATPVEVAARDILRDCLAQVAENIAVVAASDAVEGPHQLRVGLRRLRTALAIFDPALGSPAGRPLAEMARKLGRVAGELRDADVLADDLVATALALGPDPAALAALTAALAARHAKIRARVRATLASAETTRFLFDLGAFIEGRGWLLPSDYSQTARLAAPIGEVAPAMLDKRHGKALKRGRRIRSLDAEGLHALRKELKKLRYAVDMLGPIYKESRVDGYLRQLRELQDTFGSLNDAAMAAAELGGPDAPHRHDADAQRAVGWVLGVLAVRAEADRPDLFDRWDRLEKAPHFWG
ncbi:MAG: CYTH and CHAD domain-containing protein [Amaricoccus sp.]